MTIESLNKQGQDDELYLSDLFRIVFNHFLMIAIIALSFAILGFGIASIKPEKRDVSVTVQIKTPNANNTISNYGNDIYTSDSLNYAITARDNLTYAINNTDIPEQLKNMKLDDFKAQISSENVQGSLSYYRYSVNATEYPEFCINLLNTAIDNINIYAQELAENSYSITKEQIEKAIAIEKATEFTDEVDIRNQTERIRQMQSDLSRLEIYKKATANPINHIETHISDNTVGTSRLVVALVAFVLGGVIGVIIAFSIDLTDKRIYSIRQLYRLYSKDDVLANIALYKSPLNKNASDIKYMAMKLQDKGKNILVTSISERAGKTTIATGLESALEDDCSVIDGDRVSNNPDMLSKAKCSDVTLLIVKAGFDSSVDVNKALRDLLSVDAKNIYIVFNGVECSDKELTLYENKSAYKKHLWLLETWRCFFKKKSF